MNFSQMIHSHLNNQSIMIPQTHYSQWNTQSIILISLCFLNIKLLSHNLSNNILCTSLSNTSSYSNYRYIIRELIPYLEAVGIIFAGWKIGTAIQGAVKGFQEAQIALSLFKLQSEGATIAQGLFNGTLTLGETLVGLFTGKVTLAELATAGLSKAQAVLNAVMSANPVALVIIEMRDRGKRRPSFPLRPNSPFP